MQVADPNVAVLLMVVGALCICVEFCRPGSVLPGVIGGLIGLVGLSSFVAWVREPMSPAYLSWPFIAALIGPFLVITAYLLRTAVRARRNKTSGL